MASVGAPVDIIALLRDVNGDPVVGKTVRMSASDSTPAQEGVTDASGEATFEVTSNVPATVTYFMTELEQAVDSESTVQVTYSGTPQEYQFVVVFVYDNSNLPPPAPVPVEVYVNDVLVDTIAAADFSEIVMLRTSSSVSITEDYADFFDIPGSTVRYVEVDTDLIDYDNLTNEVRFHSASPGVQVFLNIQISYAFWDGASYVFFDWYVKQQGGAAFDGSGDIAFEGV